MKSSVFLLSTAEDCAIIKNVRKRVKQSKMRLLISCRGTKGPPDGPPIFLIFVKPLKWPQSQAYQSFLTFRSRFTLVGWAFWMSFIDLHRELDSTRCPEIGKTQNPPVATPCRFESGHRHQAEPGRNSRSRLSFFFCLAARVRGLLRKKAGLPTD